MDTRFLGRVDYLPIYEAMQLYTEQRHAEKNSENTIENYAQPAYLLPDYAINL